MEYNLVGAMFVAFVLGAIIGGYYLPNWFADRCDCCDRKLHITHKFCSTACEHHHRNGGRNE